MRTGGDHDAEVDGDLAAQRLDPVEQVAAGAGVDQVDEVGGQLEAERVDLDLGGEQLRGVRPAAARRVGAPRRRLGLVGVGDPRGGQQHHAAGEDERELGQARDQAQRERGEAGDPQRHLVAGDLADDVGAHVVLAGRRG